MNGYYDIVTSNQYIVGTVSWYEYGVDNVNNKSWVHAELRLSRTNNYTSASSNGTYYLNIAGETFSAASNINNKITYNSGTLVISAEKEIYHDNDGSKNIEIGVSANISIFTIDYQNTWAWLTTIPRESSLTFNHGVVGDTLRLDVNRNSDYFTHTISYSFGNLSGVVATNVGTYYDWLIPNDFYSQISGYYGLGYLYLDTYNGNNKVGETKSYSFVVWCNQYDCIPSITGSIKDTKTSIINLTGSTDNNPILVDNQSLVELNLSYSAKNYATIKKIFINGIQRDLATQYYFKYTGSNFEVVVEDSRGYQNSIVFQSNDENAAYYFKRIQYVNLSIDARTKRPSQTGSSMQVDISGSFFNGNFKEDLSNTLSITWEVRELNDTSWTQGATVITPTITNNGYYINNLVLQNPLTESGEWDYKKIYKFAFRVFDKVMIIETLDTRPKGKYNFAIFPKKIMNAHGEDLNLKGSSAVFYKSDVQNITGGVTTTIIFNEVSFNDNEVFELLSDGTIKVLKDISRVYCSVNIRTDTTGGFVYVNGNNGGFNCGSESGEFCNASGVLEVAKDSIISVSTYRNQNGFISGYGRSSVGISLTVLR